MGEKIGQSLGESRGPWSLESRDGSSPSDAIGRAKRGRIRGA